MHFDVYFQQERLEEHRKEGEARTALSNERDALRGPLAAQIQVGQAARCLSILYSAPSGVAIQCALLSCGTYLSEFQDTESGCCARKSAVPRKDNDLLLC